MAKKTATRTRPATRTDEAPRVVSRLDERKIAAMPAKELRKIVQNVVRRDGWISALTGAGTVRDKKQYAHFVAAPTNWRENIDLWRGDGLAGRIVELPPNEELREGWELHVEGPDGPDISRKVIDLLEDLHFNDRLRQARCLERAVGGAGVVMGVNDLEEDQSQELNFDKINELKWMETFEPLELFASSWQNDPNLPGFGRPDKYRLVPVSPGGVKKGAGREIHASRILVFPGIVVSRRQITSQLGWGDAVLTRCRETVRDFQTAWGAIGHLIAEYGVAVWKIKGLAEIISMDKDEILRSRVEMMQLAMSAVNAAVIDAELEDFDRKQVPLTGLSDVLREFGARLAADADIPMTLLFGMSPGGMNATGEFDSRSWFDRIKSSQEHKLRPHIERAVKIAFRAIGVEEPASWTITFKPLSQPTEQEKVQTRYTQAQTDQIYFNMGSLGKAEIREQRFSGRQYSSETHVSGPPPVDAQVEAPQDQAAVDAASAAQTAADVGAPVPTPLVTSAGPREAFTGIQISSMMQIVQSVAKGELDRSSAKAILMTGFPIDDRQADALLGAVKVQTKE